MALDIALNPLTGELLYSAGRLSTVTGGSLVAQRARIAIGTQRGEWALDTDHGVDYRGIALNKAAPFVLEASIRAVLVSRPGAKRVVSLLVTRPDPASRDVAVAFELLATDGETVAGSLE
jgi:hypothetical protein